MTDDAENPPSGTVTTDALYIGDRELGQLEEIISPGVTLRVDRVELETSDTVLTFNSSDGGIEVTRDG